MFQNINFYAPLISYSLKLHILQHKIGTLQLEIHSFIQTSGNSTAQQCFRPILSLPIGLVYIYMYIFPCRQHNIYIPYNMQEGNYVGFEQKIYKLAWFFFSF